MSFNTIAARIICAAMFCGSAFVSAEADPVRTENVEAEIVLENAAIRPGETFWAGLRMDIREGWHTFWRNPGDAGLPTTLDWRLPPGFEAGEIRWPLPERMIIGEPPHQLANYGYHNGVLLAVPITAPADLEPTGEVVLAARARWQVCEEICIPEEAELATRVFVATGENVGPSRWKALFDRARSEWPAIAEADAAFNIENDEILIALDAAPGALRDVFFFPYEEGLVRPAAEQTAMAADGRAFVRAETDWGASPDMEQVSGILAYAEDGERRGVEFIAQRDPGLAAPARPVTPAKPLTVFGVAQAFFFALIGGLILNLMPCVFPVLFVKAVGFVQKAHGDAAALKRHGLVFTAGVVTSFLALAVALIAIRSAGAQIGWGFQLQNPLVVVFLAYILFLVGLSLSGVFELGSRFMGAGSGLAQKEGDVGAFFTGVLAVVVAAPCTAPFMAAALAYALTQPAVVSLLIFAALGIGLAAPYLILSFRPSLLQFLPRPGPWMDRVKQLLAFPIYASVVWLFWVLSRQKDPNYVGIALLGLVFLALAVWLLSVARPGGGRGARLAQGGAAAAFLLAIISGAQVMGIPPVVTQIFFAGAKPAELPSEAWSPERVAALRAEGKTVFVDFTAAWCLTCQMNKLTAIYRPDTVRAFEANDAVYLTADWTNYDERITAELNRLGAAGVPVYAVYPPDLSAEPIRLPSLLTERIVQDALIEARAAGDATRLAGN
ncbi:MAG: thioredoxin family protein [Parvularculaceae bacterium]